MKNNVRVKIFWLISILLITIVAYYPSFQNTFTNWDDYKYVVDNLLIRDLSFESIQKIFSQYYMGNYHPLTLISLAVDYYFVGPNPLTYLITNVVLHLINTAFVFFLIVLIFKNKEVALITALLFGIHSLHVESVAWMSERKDVLYTLFFLGSLIYYVKYLASKSIEFVYSKSTKKKLNVSGKKTKRFYRLALLLFILSLFSKGMAVSLAVTLFVIDYLYGRKLLSKEVILEKIPFLLIAIIFGVIAIYAQEVEEFTPGEDSYAFYERIIFACYGFTQYLIKLVVPYKLSAFYPYPEGGVISNVYWFYLAIIPLIIFVFIKYRRKNRKLTFALLFFIINIFLVLQILPVGDAIMADRYVYISSIGFFYLIGFGYEAIVSKRKQLKIILIVIIAAYSVFLIYSTYNRTKVWKDSITLWSDVISKYPTVKIAYNNRGIGFEKANKYEKAIIDYNHAISIDMNYAEAYNNRGISKDKLDDTLGAIADYERAIIIKPNYVNAYNNRGNAKGKKGDYKGAIADFNKALKIEPENPEILFNRGIMKSNAGDLSGSIVDLNKAIKFDPAHAKAYLNRGTNKFYLRDYNGALQDFNHAVNLDAEYAEAYFNRGIVKIALDRRNEACSDLQMAAKLGFENAKQEIAKYCQ